MYWLG